MPSDERSEMLNFLGLDNVEELFSDIPAAFRANGLKLRSGLSEMEVVSQVRSMLGRNRNCSEMKCFLGSGIYDIFIPSVVSQVLSRSELYTAYTPYQAEFSQGLLQLIFEYQSLMSELTQMDAVNASMYDGSTALGEAATMCRRIREGGTFVIPRALAPWKKSVLRNYLRGLSINLVEYGFDRKTGHFKLDEAVSHAKKDACGVYAEMPNFFGLYDEPVIDLKEALGDVPLVVGVNPASLASVKPPGDYGADIVIGEGQSLGIGMNTGGPLLGVFACRKEHVRKMPGRIVGATVDADGKRAFCLTLQAREQHIRRSRATSNICTNETLLSVAASVYLSSLGSSGFADVARKTESVRSIAMSELNGANYNVLFDGPGYNEITIQTRKEPARLMAKLVEHGILGGLPIGQFFPELGNASVWAVNERMGENDIVELKKVLDVVA